MTVIPYQYVVVRCVPRVDREEFINVGLVLFADAVDYLDATFHLDHDRLHAFAPTLDLAAVEDALTVICDVCRGVTGRGRPTLATPGKRFGWLAAPRSTVVQPGPVHGGVTHDPTAQLQALADRLVGIRDALLDPASTEAVGRDQ